MTAIDATGLHALEQFSDRLRKTGRSLLLCGARDQPAQAHGPLRFRAYTSARRISFPTFAPRWRGRVRSKKILPGSAVSSPVKWSVGHSDGAGCRRVFKE